MKKSEKIFMSVANNRSTTEFVGYWIPKNGTPGIVVTAYDMENLTKQFEKAVAEYLRVKNYTGQGIKYLYDMEERQTELMIQSSKGLV